MACTTRFTIDSCLLYPFSVRRASTKNPGIPPGLLIKFPAPYLLKLCICPSYAPDVATKGTAITLRPCLIPASAFPGCVHEQK
jgi:hypothetical protein